MSSMSTLPLATGKGKGLLLGVLLILFVGPGCQSMTTTDKGVLAGGALGAGVGALAGGRHAGAGALIGGAAGAIAGGLTGSAIENSERKAEARAEAAVVAQRTLSLQEVADLTASGSSDDVIINQIRVSGAVYNLTGAQLLWLQQAGVREPVIRELQATAYRTPRRVYTAVPVAEPVYVVPVAPPPPPVGVGFTYVGGRRR